MYRFVESKLVCLVAIASFAMAIGVSAFTGSALPTFGAGLLPESALTKVAQIPLPPPSPDDPWVTLAQIPLPPPSPDDPWVRVG